MSEKNPVAQPSKLWAAQTATWDLVNTLFGGTDAMRNAAKVYLPQEPAEPESAYFNRLSRSVLTPIYPDTIKKLMGKIMKQPVILEDDVPTQVKRHKDDIDAAGTDINEFAAQVGEAALNHGMTLIMVDAPSVPEDEETGEPIALSVEAAQAVGIRPYAIHFRSPQLIGWKTQIVDGQVILTQARILMKTMEDSAEDEFTQVEIHRIWVLEIGMYRIYRKTVDADGNEDWVLERTVLTGLDFIPLIALYSNRVEPYVGTPPLKDVAWLNIAHWQSDSDQRNILHVARVPLLFGSGLGDDERGDFQIQVGPNTMTRGPQGSDMKFVEHSGAGIEAGADDLETLEQRMAKLGLNMIIRGRSRSGTETATARVLDQSEADSPLGMFARQLEKALEKMLDYFAMFEGMGDDAGGSVTVFKDFSISMRDGEDIKALADMRARNDISQLTYWEELKRRNLLNEDFDPDTEIDLLDLEFQDSEPGLTEQEKNAGNRVGDETGEADGHTHVLQEGGYTNTVDGHKHRWEPTGSETTGGTDHEHSLRGIPDGQEISRAGQSQDGAPPAGES